MVRLFSLCSVLSLMLALPVRAESGVGTLTELRGHVWVQIPSAEETVAQQGQSLPPGTRIRTGDDGSAQVQFADGALLQVRAKSQLQLSGAKRHKKSKNSVLLFFGRVWSKVAKSAGGDTNYEVTTANAVCGVRGTEFETAVADDGSVKVQVTEGTVAVGDDQDQQQVQAGNQTQADENGVEAASQTTSAPQWNAWQKQKRERLRNNGRQIVDAMKGKIMQRKDKLQALRKQQEALEAQRKAAEQRARAGDASAVDEVRSLNDKLVQIADQIADIGDVAQSQFGTVDHFADLANDPKFRMIDRKYLISQAASLRRIKAMFDKMVQEGTDISMEAMDQMLKDMSNGKRDSLKDKDSAADDLFGDDDDMDFR